MQQIIKRVSIIQLIVLLTLLSCQQPDLTGHWHISNEYGEFLWFWDIKNDSITMNDENSFGPDSFMITTTEIKIPYLINGTYKYLLNSDTCTIISKEEGWKYFMVRKTGCKSYEHEIDLKIFLKLPEFSEHKINRYLDYSNWKNYHIYVGNPKDKSKHNFIQLNNELGKLEDIKNYIDETWIYDSSTGNYDYLTTILFVDKDIKMKNIDRIMFELRANYIVKIAFAFDVRENIKKTGLVFRKLYPFSERYLRYFKFNYPPPPPQMPFYEEIRHTKYLRVSIKNNNLFINDSITTILQLGDSVQYYLSKQMKKTHLNLLIIDWDENSNFQTYAEVAVLFDYYRHKYLEKQSIIEYGKNYKELSESELKDFRRKYQIGIVDFSPTDRKVLGNIFE